MLIFFCSFFNDNVIFYFVKPLMKFKKNLLVNRAFKCLTKNRMIFYQNFIVFYKQYQLLFLQDFAHSYGQEKVLLKLNRQPNDVFVFKVFHFAPLQALIHNSNAIFTTVARNCCARLFKNYFFKPSLFAKLLCKIFHFL